MREEPKEQFEKLKEYCKKGQVGNVLHQLHKMKLTDKSQQLELMILACKHEHVVLIGQFVLKKFPITDELIQNTKNQNIKNFLKFVRELRNKGLEEKEEIQAIMKARASFSVGKFKAVNFPDIPWDVVRHNILPKIPPAEWKNVALINKAVGKKFSDMNTTMKMRFQRDFPVQYERLKHSVQNWTSHYAKQEVLFEDAYPDPLEKTLLKAVKQGNPVEFLACVNKLAERGQACRELLEKIEPGENLPLLTWIWFHRPEFREAWANEIYEKLILPHLSEVPLDALYWSIQAHRPLSEITEILLGYEPTNEGHYLAFQFACESGHKEVGTYLLNLAEEVRPPLSEQNVMDWCNLADDPAQLKILMDRLHVQNGSDYANILRTACSMGRIKCVKMLLEIPLVKAEMHTETYENTLEKFIAPFPLVCTIGNIHLVRLFIQHRTPYMESASEPFFSACEHGHLAIVKLLLKQFPRLKPSLSSLIRVNDLRTALETACKSGNPDVVKLLLNNGADPNHMNFNAPVICHVLGNFEVLSRGSETDFRRWEAVLKALLTHKGKNAVNINHAFAAECQLPVFSINTHIPAYTVCANVNALAFLLSQGADPELDIDGKGKTPIECVYEKENMEAFKLLLKAGVTLKPEFLDKILLEANPPFIKALFDEGYGHHIDRDNYLLFIYRKYISKDSGPLQRKSCCELMYFLLEHGADASVCDENGVSFFRHVCSLNKPKMVANILFRVKDPAKLVNTPNNEGRTPLFRAGANGFLEVIRILLKYGADPTHRDLEGKTAAERVSTKSKFHPYVVNLLSEAVQAAKMNPGKREVTGLKHPPKKSA